MAGRNRPPTADRNLQPGADSLRHVQVTTFGINRSSPEYQAGDLDALRSLRKVLHGAVTRLLTAATELREAPSPPPLDLLEALNELKRKDGELNELDTMISDLLGGPELEKEIEGS